MTWALALLLSTGALDAGQHGAPFALHGVGGVPVWEQYRRNELGGAANYPPVSLARDGGLLVFSGVRQGCNGADCASQAPGVFISRVPGPSTPPYSPVSLGTMSRVPFVFDLRLALLEAAVDGGLRAFVTAGGGDLGPKMDTYFPPGVDGLIVHLSLDADGPTRSGTVQRLTCATASSALREDLRIDYSSELTTPAVASLGQGAALGWGVADAGAGKLALSIFAESTLAWRWEFPASRLSRCGNDDDGGYADGSLDVGRLVPVLFVGWATWADPVTPATLTMTFRGHSPRFDGVVATASVGVPVAVPHSLASDDGSRALGVATPLTLRIEGPDPVAVEVTQPGLAAGGQVVSTFTPHRAGTYRLSLELAGPDVAAEWLVSVQEADGGADAGASGASDAGASPGGEPTVRSLTVGCGCATPAPSLWLVWCAVAAGALAYRRKARAPGSR